MKIGPQLQENGSLASNDLHYPSRNFVDESSLLRHSNKQPWTHDLPVRTAPADQGFCAHAAPAAKLDDGLVEHEEFLSLQGNSYGCAHPHLQPGEIEHCERERYTGKQADRHPNS